MRYDDDDDESMYLYCYVLFIYSYLSTGWDILNGANFHFLLVTIECIYKM